MQKIKVCKLTTCHNKLIHKVIDLNSKNTLACATLLANTFIKQM